MSNMQEDYDSLKRHYNSLCESIEGVQTENTKLKAENALLLAKLTNCQKALDINKEIMRNAIAEQNRVQVDYGQEIQELKAKIKELVG